MTAAFLFLHSFLRWVVLALAVAAVVLAWRGFVGGKPYAPTTKKTSTFFIISLDVQFLIGLVLYAFLSPTMQQAFADFGAAMKTRALRFFAVEHVFLMVLAVALAHIGHRQAKKAADDKAKHKRAAIFFTIALVLLLAGIPWPFLGEIARPWLRF